MLWPRLSFLPLHNPCPCLVPMELKAIRHVPTILFCVANATTPPSLCFECFGGQVHSTLILFFRSRVTLTSFLPLVSLSSKITCQEVKSGCFALTEILLQIPPVAFVYLHISLLQKKNPALICVILITSHNPSPNGLIIYFVITSQYPRTHFSKL